VNWYKFSKINKEAQIPIISSQEANDKKLFGPVYHGTSSENINKIIENGFSIYIGESRQENISHGYDMGNYYNGIPAPVHHLGFGIYFSTIKNIAKEYNYGTSKGLKEFYLDVPRLEIINFGSPKTMMNWWIKNGYSPELALVDRVAATQSLTNYLSSNYDAVWYKGKGMYRLLDGDQICIYDTNRIYIVDKNLSSENEIGFRVKRNSDGMIGNIIEAYSLEDIKNKIEEFNSNGGRHFLTNKIPDWESSGVKNIFRIKWRKGNYPNDYYTDQEITSFPLKAKL